MPGISRGEEQPHKVELRSTGTLESNTDTPVLFVHNQPYCKPLM